MGKGTASMGKFVKCPKFTGDESKVSADDMEILKLCNGSRTDAEIAAKLGISKADVIKILAKYRKVVQMIGKTI